MNEQELIRRIKAGDARAFEELVSQFESKIYSLALRYLGSPQDALDVCQEVFLRIYRFVGNFSEESRLSTWIYRIAANVCKDALARRSRTQALPLAVDDGEDSYSIDIPDERYSPQRSLEELELRQALSDAIDSLPEHYRAVIMLRDVTGLSYDEIGRALELEEGTVKSRIARARQRLREILLSSGNISPSTRSNHLKGGDA